MSLYYCHQCATKLGLLAFGAPSNLTGSVYQVGKFIKHTVPTVSAKTTGVFADPSYTAYEDYVIHSQASGSVEIDAKGRVNVVWYAGKTIGASLLKGQVVLPNDTVKLVLPFDPPRIHAYSIASTGYSTQTCILCRNLILV